MTPEEQKELGIIKSKSKCKTGGGKKDSYIPKEAGGVKIKIKT